MPMWDLRSSPQRQRIRKLQLNKRKLKVSEDTEINNP